MGRNVSFTRRDALEAAFSDCRHLRFPRVDHTGRIAESMGSEMDDQLVGNRRLDDDIVTGMEHHTSEGVWRLTDGSFLSYCIMLHSWR